MVSIKNITKKFGTLKAADNISIDIKTGDCFALLGPNGAGKTTLIKMLMGFLKPDSGQITIDGINSSESLSRKNLGYMGENHPVPGFLSGREFLRRHASLSGLSDKTAHQNIDDVLDKTGMTGAKDKKLSRCSKGMVRRIALASALLGAPELLILDEPAAGLDPIGMRDFRNILTGLREKGTTVILNSHILSEVERVCTTAAIMYKGSIMTTGYVKDLVKEKDSLEDLFMRMVK